ncbi:MAG: hypothetical protein AAF843_13765 [Bacteroidota bacterium]
MSLYLKTIFFFISLFPSVTFGQKESLIAFGGSANSYRGELSNYGTWSGGVQVGLIFNKNKKLSGSLQFGLGTVSGSDRSFALQTNAGEPTPNTFTKTNFSFLNYAARFTFLRKSSFSAYVSQGMGFMRFNPKDEFGDDLIDQDTTRPPDEEYRNISLILPTGLGAVYLFDNGFGINLEGCFMNTASDHIDNIAQFGDSKADNLLSTRLTLLIPFNR